MKYITAYPVEVMAEAIEKIHPINEIYLPVDVATGDPANPIHTVLLTEQMIASYTPKVGDYVVTRESGCIYVCAKDVFEREYRPSIPIPPAQGAPVRAPTSNGSKMKEKQVFQERAAKVVREFFGGQDFDDHLCDTIIELQVLAAGGKAEKSNGVRWGMDILEPYEQLFRIAEEMKPELNCAVFLQDGLRLQTGLWGVTQFPLRKSGVIKIALDASMQPHHAVEILAHELAHAVAGATHPAHPPEFWTVHDEIKKRYSIWAEGGAI